MKVKDLISWFDSLNQKSKRYNHVFYKICFLLSLTAVIYSIHRYYENLPIFISGIIIGILVAMSLSLLIRES